MLRCCELNVPWDLLDKIDCGAVLDMIIERGNDAEEYPYLATQDDIDSFFGGA